MVTDYDRSMIPRIYDESRRLDPSALAAWVDPLQKYLRGYRNMAVDLGCGTGRYTGSFVERLGFSKVVGIDPSHSMLSVAMSKTWGEGISFISGSATAIPLQSSVADLVFMSMVLHHISDDDKLVAVREIVRVLRPGGILAIKTVAPDDFDGMPILQHFSTAHECERRRMPALDAIQSLCLAGGITPLDVLKVTQASAPNPSAYVEKIEKRGYSSLEGIADDEFQLGLTSLKEAMSRLPQGEPVYETMTLVVGRR